MTDFARLSQQMANFRESDQARDHFVSVRVASAMYAFGLLISQELLASYKKLLDEHRDLRNDYDVERDNRRRYQNTVEQKHHLVGEYERQFVSNP